MRTSLLWIAIALSVTACAEPPKVNKPRDQMTEREKQAAIANSGLPGAGVVKRGMTIADQEAKHSAMLDSASNEN